MSSKPSQHALTAWFLIPLAAAVSAALPRARETRNRNQANVHSPLDPSSHLLLLSRLPCQLEEASPPSSSEL